MNIEQEIQNILDRNFTRGDNAKALKELLVLYSVVRQSEQLPTKTTITIDDSIILLEKALECVKFENKQQHLDFVLDIVNEYKRQLK